MSEEMLKTAFVIRWWIAAEHCTVEYQLASLVLGEECIPLATGTAQY